MMTFHMTPGSCSTGIHILLEEIGLIFSASIVDLLRGDQYTPEFRAINPKCSIPVLEPESGPPLTDFISIATWLAKTYPKAQLLPENETTHGDVLGLMRYILEFVHGEGYTRIFTSNRYAADPQGQAGIEQEGWALVTNGFNQINTQLAVRPIKADTPADQRYAFGRFSIADAALFYVEFWADRISLPMPERCQAHYQLMKTRPAVRQVLMEEGYRP